MTPEERHAMRLAATPRLYPHLMTAEFSELPAAEAREMLEEATRIYRERLAEIERALDRIPILERDLAEQARIITIQSKRLDDARQNKDAARVAELERASDPKFKEQHLAYREKKMHAAWRDDGVR